MLLEARKLVKEFTGPAGPVRALDDVSVSLDAGEFVAVQGPSGCGKTTLLLALGGLLHPTSGTIRVDGTDPYQLSPEGRARWRAARIGFVFQQFHLVPYLSVLDNVLAASLATGRADAPARARELIERFGLRARSAHVPASLSTGERQRTALARALLNEPKVLLADEPTGNLDDENGRRVLEHLAEFTRAGGAVLLVTHSAAAAACAGRVVHLKNGQLAGA